MPPTWGAAGPSDRRDKPGGSPRLIGTSPAARPTTATSFAVWYNISLTTAPAGRGLSVGGTGMNGSDRRAFLADVGKGMLVASVGPSMAAEMGLARASAADGPTALTFDHREPLVALLQETPPPKLLPILVEKLKGGVELKELVASAALANARTFGGENYLGFHVFMALKPAYDMAKELPTERQALPVLKVLYRNATGMQAVGCKKGEKLTTVPVAESAGSDAAEKLRQATNKGDKATAERILAGLAKQSPDAAFNAVLLGCKTITTSTAWCRQARLGGARFGRQGARRRCGGNRRKRRANGNPKQSRRNRSAARCCPGCSISIDSSAHHWATERRRRVGSTRWSRHLPKPESASDAVAAALAEGFAPNTSAKRFHWRQPSSSCGKSRIGPAMATGGGRTAIRLAFMLPTPSTLGATWRASATRATASPA